jgi:outer membrane protein TolC
MNFIIPQIVGATAIIFVLAACESPRVFDADLQAVASSLDDGREIPGYFENSVDRRADVNAGLLDFAIAAVLTSPRVGAAQSHLSAAEDQIEESRAAFLPQLSLNVELVGTGQEIQSSSNSSFEGNNSVYTTLDASLVARQVILDFAASADVARVRAEAEARAAEVAVSQQEVLDVVLGRYIDAAEALERLALAEAEIAYYRILNADEALQVSEGGFRRSQRGATLAELARAQSDYAIGLSDYRIRVDLVCRLTAAADCPLPRAVSLSRALPRPVPLTEAERNAITTAPEQVALRATLSAALREVERAQMQMRPTLSAYLETARRDRGGSLFDGSSVTDTVDLGVVVNWDFYQGNRQQAAASREMNEAFALAQEIEARLREQMGELEAADAALAALWLNDIALQRVVQARFSAVAAFRAEVSAGDASRAELARSELELVRALVLRQATRRTFVSATVAKERATGTISRDTVEFVGNVLSDAMHAPRIYRLAISE